jgi:hypothetical protein
VKTKPLASGVIALRYALAPEAAGQGVK